MYKFCIIFYVLFGRTTAFFNNGMPCDVINGFNCDRFSVDTDERICDTNGILYHNFCAFDQAVCKDSTVVIDSSFSCLLSPATATVKLPTTTTKTTTTSTTKMSTTAQILITGTTDLPTTTTKKTTLPTTQFSTITSNLTSGNLMTSQIPSKTSTKKIQSTTMTHLSTTVKPNSTTPKPYSTTPKPQPTTPQPNSTTSKPKPTTPQPNSTTSKSQPTTQQPNSTIPEPRSTTALPSGSSTLQPTRSQLEQMFCDNKNIIACHNDPNKVCGTDGVTYDNNCEFAKVQCDNFYLQIKNAGDCSP
ncbi:salivary glue protein Sgs-3-like isoform X1 [Mytilus californianus]|uniref:salivary glue protein Sgs-3-like isoform X1 n=2 Tax=Mytilus californianus TaxID=6549 RepID=UPI002245D1BE|nr:salivary glue protein Sgs-3-like isoform X1 [Mytilus californianus]